MLQISYKYSMGHFNTIYFVGVDIVKTVCQVQSLLLPGCYYPYWSGNTSPGHLAFLSTGTWPVK